MSVLVVVAKGADSVRAQEDRPVQLTRLDKAFDHAPVFLERMMKSRCSGRA
ncbi:hypothetical protein [Muricoccus radiodurans]|uniref:hypothetical protein n=1 Tax=Muricoccus radiodurans TaxID=2231721 RepID=UPI003CF9CD97